MFIIKLGGSAITKKSKQEYFQHEIMENLAKEIKKANKKIILVHGAGSFGHINAKKYELNKGYKNQDQIYGFSITQALVQKLNYLVLNSLHSNGVPAISISPHTILTLNNHKLNNINYTIFKEYLDKQFIPVTYGDVALDKKLGFSICSGDLIVMALTKYFKPTKVIFILDEDGLYTSNPKTDNKAKFIEEIALNDLKKLTTTLDNHADVTKGMKGKIDTIRKISDMGIDTILLNGNKQGRLFETLNGKKTKRTIVYGEL